MRSSPPVTSPPPLPQVLRIPVIYMYVSQLHCTLIYVIKNVEICRNGSANNQRNKDCIAARQGISNSMHNPILIKDVGGLTHGITVVCHHPMSYCNIQSLFL